MKAPDEHPHGRDALGRVCGKGQRDPMPCLNSPPSPRHVFPTLKACQTLGIFIEASSWRHDESVASFPASLPFQEIGGGAEHSKLPILALAC